MPHAKVVATRQRPRRARDGWVGPPGARRCCWISTTHHLSVLFIPEHGVRVKTAIVYSIKQTMGENERPGTGGGTRCVTCRSPRSLKLSKGWALCLHTAPTSFLASLQSGDLIGDSPGPWERRTRPNPTKNKAIPALNKAIPAENKAHSNVVIEFVIRH